MKTNRLSYIYTIVSFIILSLAIPASPGFGSPESNSLHFDAQGTIDAINMSTNYISINDIAYHFAPNPLFFRSHRQPIPARTFKPGDKVAYILDTEQRIKLLWLLRRKN